MIIAEAGPIKSLSAMTRIVDTISGIHEEPCRLGALVMALTAAPSKPNTATLKSGFTVLAFSCCK